MKRWQIITLLVLFILSFIIALLVFNYFGIISLQSWGEQIMVRTPFLQDYIKTDTQYDKLKQKYEELNQENNDLTVENEKLKQQLKTSREKIENLESQLNELNQQLSSIQQEEQSREDKIKKLVGIYSSMEPAQVAPIIKSMNEDLAILLLSRLENEHTARILSNLTSEEAARFSDKIQQ